MSLKKPLVVTMGDPAGIGGEIVMGAWQLRETLPPFCVIDDPDRLRALAPNIPVTEIDSPAQAIDVFATELPVLPLSLPVPVTPGHADPRTAAKTIEAIDMAVALTQSGDTAGVVTNPVTKKLLYEGAGFAHAGHTEYLAELAGVTRTVMMLAAPGLRVVPATIHIPLCDVPAALSIELIAETARILDHDLRRWFGLGNPRIAVAGLNPHAGEGGTMGLEEVDVIGPAITMLAEEGLAIQGPFPADTMFHAEARARYDVALAMYHDQALVPIKTLDFARGVNVTLGLPFIRTSPDHGTAYNIAGSGRADPTSLIEAIRLAGQMAQA